MKPSTLEGLGGGPLIGYLNPTNVGLGSKSEVAAVSSDVRFSPDSDHIAGVAQRRFGAKLGSIGLDSSGLLATLRGIILLRTLPSSVCFGENCDASET